MVVLPSSLQRGGDDGDDMEFLLDDCNSESMKEYGHKFSSGSVVLSTLENDELEVR